MPTLPSVLAHVERTHNQYELRVAGHALLTRNPALLRMLIDRMARLRDAVVALDGVAEPDRQAALALCLDRLAIYEFQLAALDQALAASGPAGVEATHIVARANFVLSRYHRDFGGEERDTRDPGLLAELIAELRQLHARLEACVGTIGEAQREVFSDDLAWMREHAETLQSEHGAILAAQAPEALPTRVSVLAELANSQFDRHRQHFEHQPPISRRPGLLEDMLNNLKDTRARMMALGQLSPTLDHNDANIRVVDKHLVAWQEQLGKLQAIRARSSTTVLLDHFREAVDAELRLYNHSFAEQGRAAPDLVLLGTICDRLGELARQMAPLCDETARTEDHQALEKVRDACTMLTNEWGQLLRAATEDGVEPMV
ncbi:MAG: hypothetical protein KC502_15555 [Myxococcales bacterium]|nr:hypothetical protein [Myxococcales bacterium]